MLTLILYINFSVGIFSRGCCGLTRKRKTAAHFVVEENQNQATMKNYHFNLLDGFTTVIIFILNGGLVCRVFFYFFFNLWERLQGKQL